MFKIITLVSLLAIGASASAASASPHRSFIDRDRYHRYDRHDDFRSRHDRRFDDFGPRQYRRTWLSLGTLEIANDGRDMLRVFDRGTFTQLRLQTTGGRVHVDAVAIHFADGSKQIARLGRTLGAYDRFVEIPLDGNNRRIDRITAVGGSRFADLQVFGI
jgi:hypothetical protein